MAAVWPIISNKETIEISQTWVASASQPSGRLVKSWQAPNLPTIVAPSCKCLPGNTNRNHECTPPFDCSVCSAGNLSDDGVFGANQSWPGIAAMRGWEYDATAKTMSRPASAHAAGKLCLDVKGQLPGGLNYQHMLPCDGSSAQQWNFNDTSGLLQSVNDTTQCLQGAEWWTWLGRPMVTLGGCQVRESQQQPIASDCTPTLCG